MKLSDHVRMQTAATLTTGQKQVILCEQLKKGLRTVLNPEDVV